MNDDILLSYLIIYKDALVIIIWWMVHCFYLNNLFIFYMVRTEITIQMLILTEGKSQKDNLVVHWYIQPLDIKQYLSTIVVKGGFEINSSNSEID